MSMEFFYKVSIKDKNNVPIWEHCANTTKVFDDDKRTFDFYRNKNMIVEVLTINGRELYPLDENFELKL